MSATTQEQQGQRSATEERVRKVWAEVFVDKDLSKASEWWSDDSTDEFLALGLTARGATELTAFFRELFDAVPDIEMRIEHIVADDTTRHAVLQWHFTGTTNGKPFQGIEPPAGKRLDLRGCDVFQLDEDGRVLTNTIYYDGAEFARQIGMLPPRDSALDRSMVAGFNAVTRLRTKLNR
ncbi:MAG TPA: ester cyclase [Solirubrobacteraceae bacterium]|nr:ester cyclase [Solirubrobacteraceae bacterium]